MISDRLRKVVERVLGRQSLKLEDEMLATEVPGWDSLTHVTILTAIEDEYGIRFQRLEIVRLRNLGALQALVDSKLAGR